jgi:hypothetical protein
MGNKGKLADLRKTSASVSQSAQPVQVLRIINTTSHPPPPMDTKVKKGISHHMGTTKFDQFICKEDKRKS